VDVVVEPAQSLESIRHAITVYATRLARVRDRIRELLAGAASPAWLPPDPAALLPDGPVSLRRERIECEPDDAGQPQSIELDEQVDTDGLGVPVLLGLAHQDWAALSWLFWAVGEGAAPSSGQAGAPELRLPAAITPPSELVAAMQMIVRRTWRIKDRVGTGSLVARSKGVPGFEWQGVDIDELPQHSAQLAAGEYVAVRSMFLWLVSADTLSPFQDDIRDA
jgi:hypothetical protein